MLIRKRIENRDELEKVTRRSEVADDKLVTSCKS